MDNQFWIARWNENQIGFHQDDINSHLQTHWPKLGARPGCEVFVPLCGKSRDMLWLRGQGHRVLGIEISELAVQAFFEENQLQPQVREQGDFLVFEVDGLRILCGDFFALCKADLAEIGAVFDRASLVALPQQMRADYARHLQAILPGTAPILLVGMDYDQQQMDGPPFAVSDADVHSYYAAAYEVREVARLDILAENPRFAERGLTRLDEPVYRLTPKS